MSKPSGALLLTTHKRNPLVTASAQTLPDIWVPIHPSRFLRLLKWTTCRSADTMCETLIVPESAVLQDEPSARFADSTPAFTLVAVTPDPTRRVQITVEAKFLFVRQKIWVVRVHVFRWWRHLFLVKGGIEIGRIA
jgi:hypothetical protein